MDEFILYAYNFRSRAERVLWTLHELGFTHKVVRLDPSKGETRTPEFMKLSPALKVPVLVQGERVFTESVAIMEYLNDISVTKHLVPTAPLAVYRYRSRIHFGLTEIEPYLWLTEQATRLKRIYTWPVGTAEEAIKRAQQSLESIWSWADSRGHIASDEFSLADIYYYHLITWASQLAIAHPPVVADYLARMEARPAMPEEMCGK